MTSAADVAFTEARAASEGLVADVLHTQSEIRELAPAWERLAARCASPVLFQTHGWCRRVIAAYQEAGTPVEPAIITIERDGELVALWPLKIERSLGARVATDLTDPFHQYSDVLLAPDEDQPTLLLAALQVAMTLPVDGIVIRKVRADTELNRLMSRVGRVLSVGEAAASIDFGSTTDYETFLLTVKSKTRKNIRNARNRFERIGVLSHRVEQEAQGIAAALDLTLHMRREWLDEHGLSSRAFAHKAFTPLVFGLGEPHADDLKLVAMTLELEGIPAALQWGFIHNRRYYAYMTGRNPALADFSPGKLHLDYAFRAAHGLGCEVADLMAPAVPYKLAWATSVIPITDYVVPVNMRGRVALEFGQGHLRKAAKRAFMTLPESVRRPLAKTLNGAATPVVAEKDAEV